MNEETLKATSKSPRAFGAPRISDHGQEILAFHLHRFLSPFLVARGLDRVRVLSAFEGASLPCLQVDVRVEAATILERDASADFEALATAWREPEEAPLQIASSASAEGTRFAAIGIPMPGERSFPQLLGFALLSPEASLGEEALRDLQHRAAEAIRAARRNAVRMLFEEAYEQSTKAFLYTLLDQLPDWCGVDHSAALILTRNLEGMTLDSPQLAEFELVAERLYCDRDEAGGPERLVGLFIEGSGARAGLLGQAFLEVQRQRCSGLHIFVPDDEDEREHWHPFGEPEIRLRRFATRAERPLEGMTVLVPLLGHDEMGGAELFGFLSINYRQPVPISALTGRLIEQVAERLSQRLRRSSLFNLSAKQMLLIEGVRRICHEALEGAEDAQTRLHRFIDRASGFVVESTALPCFALGYLVGAEDEAALRFVHPRGFTRFEAVDLPLHVEDARGSGIAALAARLGRPMVFSGGAAALKNSVYVNERTNAFADVRLVDPEGLVEADGWLPLSAYYKASRDQSYATLAYPIWFGQSLMGVIAVEVDRGTDWAWWTGFGSQVFYRLLANEFSVALRLLREPR